MNTNPNDRRRDDGMEPEMHWQDEEPINDLIREGLRISDSYITIARIGDDRKEAQIGSQPVSTLQRTREWLDRQAASAAVATGQARFRIRLWRPSRTAVRSVQTRMWLKPDALTIGAPPIVVRNVAPPGPPPRASAASKAPLSPEEGGPDPDYHLDAPSPTASWPATPASGSSRRPAGQVAADPAVPEPHPASRLAALAATRSDSASPPLNRTVERGDRVQPAAPRQPGALPHQPPPVQRYAPQPVPVPCPTCASAATTIAAQNSRIAELSGRVAALNVALRDKDSALSRAQQLADQRVARISTLEAEGNRAAQIIVSQRNELAEAHESAQQMIATIDSFGE